MTNIAALIAAEETPAAKRDPYTKGGSMRTRWLLRGIAALAIAGAAYEVAPYRNYLTGSGYTLFAPGAYAAMRTAFQLAAVLFIGGVGLALTSYLPPGRVNNSK